MAITESHLRPDVRNEKVNIENYTLFRTDRKNRSHGGVDMYVRDDLASSTSLLLSFSDGTIEVLVVKIQKKNQVVLVMYRPPGAGTENYISVMKKLKDILETRSSEEIIIMMGDFNFSMIKCPQGLISGGIVAEQKTS